MFLLSALYSYLLRIIGRYIPNDPVVLYTLQEATFEPYTSVYKGMENVKDYSEGLKQVQTGRYRH